VDDRRGGRDASGRVATRNTAQREAPTMMDVARATGVSQSTVSRVLSGAPTPIPIAPATRERVMLAARSLGYRPNPLARGLRGARTGLLGVIVRDITDPFFAAAIEAVSIEAAARGYNVVLGHAHGRSDEALALWGILEARHCDAILLLGDMRDQLQLIEDLHDTRVPVVALWHGSHAARLPTVTVGNQDGIDAILDHLRGLGHRRIAFVGGRRLGDIREREEAFRRHLAAHGLALAAAHVVSVANEFEGGQQALGALMSGGDPPTAIVAATDVLAIGVLHGAYERGFVVPRDLSVTGFDDIDFASVSIPSLTSVRMPVREMVAEALRLAIDEPQDRTAAEIPHRVLRPALVVRASTGRVPAEGGDGG
jgi:DNA-binding LacI/PurR family transcriptional regulator